MEFVNLIAAGNKAGVHGKKFTDLAGALKVSRLLSEFAAQATSESSSAWAATMLFEEASGIRQRRTASWANA